MKKAFTLIELLIVVAIIAILAAIAVPNFLEAQVRAKVSRAKSDFRAIATGLEAYQIDNRAYPKNNAKSWALSFGSPLATMVPTLERLTTPVAYMNSGASYTDPFEGKAQYYGANLLQVETIQDVVSEVGAEKGALPGKVYRYVSRGSKDTTIWNQPGDTQRAIWYNLESCGPDQHYHRIGSALNNASEASGRAVMAKTLYDPTNGTISRGSIWRSGGGSGKGDYFKEMVANTY